MDTANGTDDTGTAAATESNATASMRWYIVHTYSGQEMRAKKALLERARTLGFEDKFAEVLVPEESVVEMVGGQKRTSKRKFFPGYIIVHMDLDDETWHVVKGTPKITGFVGNATDPPSISDDEVDRMTQRIKEGAVKPKPLITFTDGESVRVIDRSLRELRGLRRRSHGRQGKASGDGSGLRARDTRRPRLHERRESMIRFFPGSTLRVEPWS